MGVNYFMKQVQKLSKNDKLTRQILSITLLITIINSVAIIAMIITMGIYVYNNQDAPDMVKVPIEVIEDLDYPPVPTEQLRFDKWK